MRNYVTFGQVHVHSINGKTFDKDCVAVYESKDAAGGRELAFEYFGRKFCFHYTEETWDKSYLAYFPRGYLELK